MRNLEQFIQKKSKGDYRITVVPCTGSTNQDLRAAAKEGAPEGTVLFAEEQRAGRGRMGRSFFSPKGSGLYFSVLLRPQGGDAIKITAAAGVAVARAVEEILGLDLKIKWVNDLYYRGKKVCGILAEGAINQKGGFEYCILGIGLNVAAPKEGFGALDQIAGALLEQTDLQQRAALAASILDHFFAIYRQLEDGAYMREYQARSFLQGKRIILARGGEEISCTVEGISEEGALLAVDAQGEHHAFISGEVQIRCFD